MINIGIVLCETSATVGESSMTDGRYRVCLIFACVNKLVPRGGGSAGSDLGDGVPEQFETLVYFVNNMVTEDDTAPEALTSEPKMPNC